MTAPHEPPRLYTSASNGDRVAFAASVLVDLPKDANVTLITPSLEAAAHVSRVASLQKSATFGIVRTTLALEIASIARPELSRRGLVRASSLTLEAVCQRLARDPAADLDYFAEIAAFPGFARALARTLSDLRLAEISPADTSLADHRAGKSLAKLAASFAAALSDLGLADERATLDAACAVLAKARAPRLVVLVDVPIRGVAEEMFVRALAGRDSLVFAVPSFDEATLARLDAMGAVKVEPPVPFPRGPLHLLKERLLGESEHEPPPKELTSAVRIRSAPGESRECVEIAREIEVSAKAGIPFDRIAILLRSPEIYVPHVVEALRRARIPAHFARGLRLPDPSGRALLALLACAAEGLSARRFAEYMSLGETPRRFGDAPPPPKPGTFAPSDDESTTIALERADDGDGDGDEDTPASTDGEPIDTGTVAAPYRWERLLVEAAVIGGKDRWERRLAGLLASMREKLALYTREEDPRAEGAAKEIASLEALRGFALPLLDDLAALGTETSWRGWIVRLSALATRALRKPERVLAVLSELFPLDDDATLGLSEVRAVLEPRLSDVRQPATGRRLGKIFVGAIEDAQGLSFDTVFVPGLVEKAFPKKVLEDPLFLDAARKAVSPALATNDDRSRDERRMLRLATGAADRLVVYSYPRLDADSGRPRTPSFYGLEILRVATGEVPSYENLKKVANTASRARLGWPAPDEREDAIDEAEHDLAVLAALLGHDEAKTVGAARYLLGKNEHLRRALYSRAYRWRKGKYVAQDGLVEVPAASAARAALDLHATTARSFSPTALQNFAACPYRFYLSALLKLSKREEPAPLEEINPLDRGTLVHEAQFVLLTKLRAEGLLPVNAERLPAAEAYLETVLAEVAGRHEDRLFPAIPRVWEDGIARVTADLREWLRRMADDPVWVPSHFELSFGLVEHDDGRDAASVKEPVALDAGILMRGSIDLVERRAEDGAFRATDYKTGKVRATQGSIVSGGKILQPVLYALAVEKILAGANVVGGRLYYCTSVGDYTPIDVPLDGLARSAAKTVADAVTDALTKGMLPASPAAKECIYCDFRDVCGPYEEVRTKKRDPKALPLLAAVRALP